MTKDTKDKIVRDLAKVKKDNLCAHCWNALEFCEMASKVSKACLGYRARKLVKKA